MATGVRTQQPIISALILPLSHSNFAGKDCTDKSLWEWMTETMPSVHVTSDGPGYPCVPELFQKAGLRLVKFWDTVAIYHMHMRGKRMYVCVYMIVTAG